jgi:transcription elongation GreA/GreB family factor
VDARFKSIQRHISDIQNSLLSETKSSAGDKHETGRAMLQLEREKAGRQLAEINKLRTALSKINIEKKPTLVGLGSLVYTSKAHYLIAVSLGALKVGDDSFYAISPSTPIGQLLMGKKVGDEVSFNGNSCVIEQVL